MLLVRRLWLVIAVLSVLGGALILSVLFDSYKQSILTLSIIDQKSHARSLAKLVSDQLNSKHIEVNAIVGTLSKVIASNSLAFIRGTKDNPHKIGAIQGLNHSAVQNALSEPLGQKKEHGYLIVNDILLVWNSVSIPGSPYRLIFLQQNSNNLMSGFARDYGVPVLISFLVVGWIIVWTAIVLNSLFKKLNDQNKLLETQSQKISDARDKALNANRAKTVFLANMSHEIRTPLTAILGFSESLLHSDQSMHERISAINTINNSGKYLLHIIDEILDLSKIEAGKLDIELITVSPVKLLLEICPLMRMQAEGKGLEFKVNYQFPIPEYITTDPTRLKQILLNLVSNAVKFTEQGYIHINVSCETERQELMFEVVDTGIGMTKKQQQKVFTAFTQADTSITRKYGGTGLGLTLSRQFSTMLGGSLTVESHVGYGSIMQVVIDTGSLDETNLYDKAGQLPEEVTPQATPPKIIDLEGEVLLAEDNPTTQKLFEFYLRNAGATTTTVENGELAVNQAMKKDFDLILMDMQMPVMSGTDAVKELRKKGYAGPIVALTANNTIKDRDMCISAGCNDFVSKPVSRSKFEKILCEYLREVASGDASLSPLVSNILEDEPEMTDIVVEFINHIPEIFEKINRAATSQDWEMLKSEVHKLKGVGAGYGYPELTEIAGKIEFQISASNQHEIDSLLGMLDTYTLRIIAGKPAVNELSKQNAAGTP